MTENEANGAENSASEPPKADSVAPEEAPASEEAPAVDPVEAAQAEAAQMKEKLMRMAADFDNFRKRSRREVTDAEKKGRDNLLKDLLPVFDNLERAISHSDATSADDGGVKGLVDGINLVMKQFKDALGRLGIERVDSVGHPFDPSVHEAIQHLETSEFDPGCIAAEVQPGYKEGDRLVRPAMVVVAKAPPAPVAEVVSEEADSGSEEEGPASNSAPASSENADEESPGA